MALETAVLRLKALKIRNIFQFPFIDKPEDEALEIAINGLKMLGCLTFAEEITEIGKFILTLPLEPLLARSVVEGIFYANALKNTKIENEEH